MQHSTFLLLLLLLLFLAVSAAAENYVGIVRSSLSSTELKQLDYHVIECVDATHSRQPCRHYLVRSSSNRFATVTEHANVEHKPEHHERYRASHVSHELHTSAPMKRRRSSRGGGAAPQQQVKLLVRLWEPLSERAQERWAHDVQLTVTRRLDADPAVLVEHMSGDEASLSEASVWNYLATQSEVRSVESFLRPTLLDAYGNYVLQSNQRSECDVNVNSFGCTPLWDLGIDGGGQVMGSGDTGVNMRHCVFDDTDCAQSDEANEPPSCGGNYLEQPCSACVSYCLDSDPVSCAPADAGQRKVRTFRALVDDYTDNAAQHGTATMSLAVGRPQLASPLQTDLNRGAAYAARLAFTDIADDDGDLFVPLPLDTE